VLDDVVAPIVTDVDVAGDDVEVRPVDPVAPGAVDVVVVDRGVVVDDARGIVLVGAGRRVVGVVAAGVVRGVTVATTAGAGTTAGRTSKYRTSAETKIRLSTVVDFRAGRCIRPGGARDWSRRRSAG
jgi:hypothetical protein